jgi:acetyl-CoA carboxylase biotin carboxyl carrier protein
MTLKEIRALLDLVREYGLAELELEREGGRLRPRRDTAGEPRAAAPVPAAAGAPATGLTRETAAGNLLTIEAPMVGTFYRASSPDAAPFAREGEPVKKGQVVCIIEAMKLMNEIESKVTGRVVKVLVENAQPVEFGQPLFLVEP